MTIATHFDIDPIVPVIRGERGAEIARRFDISPRAAIRSPRRSICPLAPPSSGALCLLRGASGSGKTSLLKRLRRAARREGRTILDLGRVALPAKPVIDLFGNEPLERTLKRLARVGLAEVWTWLRQPCQLSEGQRWRLRVALALTRVEPTELPVIIVCDEFAALLDRVSAHVVSAVLRRAVSLHAGKLAAIVATSHDDLCDALEPDVDVLCDFGRYEVTRRELRTRSGSSRSAPPRERPR